MCEPTTLAVASLVLTGIGGVTTYRAQRAAADTAEQIAEQNAGIARQQAEQERQIGNIEEERQLRRVRAALGTQRATLAANGLDINTGTALDLQAETAGFGMADALNIRTNALRRAWGFEVDAVNSTNEGRARAAGYRNDAMGTLITTGASLAGDWSNMPKRAATSAARSSVGAGAMAAGRGALRGFRG